MPQLLPAWWAALPLEQAVPPGPQEPMVRRLRQSAEVHSGPRAAALDLPQPVKQPGLAPQAVAQPKLEAGAAGRLIWAAEGALPEAWLLVVGQVRAAPMSQPQAPSRPVSERRDGAAPPRALPAAC